MLDGKLYIIAGGNVLRWPVLGLGRGDVLREATKADSRYLRVRWVQLAFRGLWREADWISRVMAEIGVEPSPIPRRFRPVRKLL